MSQKFSPLTPRVRDRRRQADVERHRRHAALERGEGGALRLGALSDVAVLRQQPLVGERRADVGDHDRRAIADLSRLGPAPVDRLHPDDAPVLDQDLRRLVTNPDRAAGRLDSRLDRARDAPGAADREPAAVQVARDDEGMQGEGAFFRWQSVVAPLGSEQRPQLR